LIVRVSELLAIETLGGIMTKLINLNMTRSYSFKCSPQWPMVKQQSDTTKEGFCATMADFQTISTILGTDIGGGT
jgi:hypothetical protein